MMYQTEIEPALPNTLRQNQANIGTQLPFDKQHHLHETAVSLKLYQHVVIREANVRLFEYSKNS